MEMKKAEGVVPFKKSMVLLTDGRFRQQGLELVHQLEVGRLPAALHEERDHFQRLQVPLALHRRRQPLQLVSTPVVSSSSTSSSSELSKARRRPSRPTGSSGWCPT